MPYRLLSLICFAAALVSGGLQVSEILPPVENTFSLGDIYIREILLPAGILFAIISATHQPAIELSKLQIAIISGVVAMTILGMINQFFAAGYIPLQMFRDWSFVMASVIAFPFFVRRRSDVEAIFWTMSVFLCAGILANFIAAQEISTTTFVDGDFITSFAISRLALILALAHAWMAHNGDEEKRCFCFWQMCIAFAFLIIALLSGLRFVFVIVALIWGLIMIFWMAKGHWRPALIILISVPIALIASTFIDDRLQKRVLTYSSYAEAREGAPGSSDAKGMISISTDANVLEQCQTQVKEKLQEDMKDFSEKEWDLICSNTILYRDYDHRIRLLFKSFQDQPGIFGHGYESYEAVIWSKSGQISIYSTPHNIFAQAYHSFGPIFLLVFMVLIFSSLVIAASGLSSPDLSLSLLAAQPLVVIGAACLGGDFFDARWIWICSMILAAQIAMTERLQNKSRNEMAHNLNVT